MIYIHILFSSRRRRKRNDLKKRKTVKQHCIPGGLCHIKGDTRMFTVGILFIFLTRRTFSHRNRVYVQVDKLVGTRHACVYIVYTLQLTNK